MPRLKKPVSSGKHAALGQPRGLTGHLIKGSPQQGGLEGADMCILGSSEELVVDLGCCLGVTLSCHTPSLNSSTLQESHWDLVSVSPPMVPHLVDKLDKAARKPPHPYPTR